VPNRPPHEGNRSSLSNGQSPDYCLFLATGAERGRSNSDGENRTSGTRPVGVITSIEGVPKDELQRRCVSIDYIRHKKKLKRGPIEQEINDRRHEIGSALVLVLRRYLEIRVAEQDLPNPIPEFEEHFTEMCLLLLAYADVAGKPREWAMQILNVWNHVLSVSETEEGDLEHPLLRVCSETLTGELKSMSFRYAGQSGTLYITEAAPLLTLLQKLNIRDLPLPTNAAGLGRRLRSSKFNRVEILDQESAPQVEWMRRKKYIRPIGIFIPDDSVTELPIAV